MSDVEREKTPSWLRRYRCPQCPEYAQPRNGFSLPEFQEHVFAHAAGYLQEAAEDARQYREGLEAIDETVGEDASTEWERVNVFGLRVQLRHTVETALRRRDPDQERRRAEINADTRASDPLEQRVSLREFQEIDTQREAMAAALHEQWTLGEALVAALPKCDTCDHPATRDALVLRLCDECASPDDMEFVRPKDRSYAEPLRAFLAAHGTYGKGQQFCAAGMRPARMDAPDGPVCGCGRPSRHESGWCGYPRAEGDGADR